MKNKIFYLVMLAVTVFSLVGCEKSSEGLTRITYYATLEMNGDPTVYVDKGSTYSELGCVAVMDGKDVSNLIQVNSNVNTGKSGVYTVIYKVVNADGFSSSAKRTVVVMDMSDPVVGVYNVTADSYRVASTGTAKYGAEFEILVLDREAGGYSIDDLLGGWYCQRAGYGSDYALGATFNVNDDGTIDVTDGMVPGWGDSYDEVNDAKFEDGTISYVCVYAGMEFHVTMNKQ